MAWLRGASLLLATLDGEPAGFGLVGVFPGAGGRAVRLRGLGVARGFEGQGRRSSPHGPLRARASWARRSPAEVGEEDGGAIAFLEKRGYREVERQKAASRWSSGRWSLLPLRRLTGVEIQSWEERPDLLPAMFELYREANADIPGLDAEAEMSFEDWRVRESSARRAATTSPSSPWPGTSPSGWRRSTSSRPAVSMGSRRWRALGGDTAWAAPARPDRRCEGCGLERLYTESEERNEPMRRLNEQLGFRPIPGMVVMRGPPRFLGAGGLGYNLPSGGDLVSTWSVLRKSCKPRSPVGLVKQPGTT